MPINLFFLLILGLLVGMYSYFKPTYAAPVGNEETPKIELSSFVLYEISQNGVDHILEGTEGKMFDDRYEVTSAKFSDNTKRLYQSVQADKIVYKDNIIVLNENVHFHRVDGLDFRSPDAQYNTKNGVISTEDTFVVTHSAYRVDGKRINYDTRTDAVSADAVHGRYQLD